MFALRRSLRDRHHVDAAGLEGGEHPRGNAGRADHAFADDRDHRHPRPRGDAVDQPVRQFVSKALADAGDGSLRLIFGHGEADRALGRGLEDRRDRQARRVDGGKRAGGDAVHADHAFARDRDHRLRRQDRRAPSRIRLQRLPRRDFRARQRRIDERPDAQRDARAGDRNERARVQHLGAVMRHLRRPRDDAAAESRAHRAPAADPR